MRNMPYKTLGLFFLIAVIAINLSCEENKFLTTVSFAESGRMLIYEDSRSSYGPTLSLSTPAPRDIVVYLTSKGEADIDIDYKFTNPVVIPKGEKFTSIGLAFIDDKLDEFDENIEFFIERVEGIESLLDTTSAKVTIIDQDVADLRIGLFWGIADNKDMDLYLWRENFPGSNEFEIVQTMANHGINQGYEIIDLSGLDKDGLYGLSYVFYSGNSFFDFPVYISFSRQGSSIIEGGVDRLEFELMYGTKNLSNGTTPVRMQYFRKEGFHFKNFTAITIPQSGS